MTETSKTEKVLKEFSERELGNVKVLMVEDDTFISGLVLQKLSKSGCIPYSTGDGGEALQLAEQYQPNVIILDLMLPTVSGEEVLKTLKEHNTLKQIPVIVFSNKNETDHIQKILDTGAAEYLVKATTELDALVEVVKKVVAKNS